MRFLGAKYAKNTFDLQRSPDSLAGFKGSTSRGREGKRGEKKRGKGGGRSKMAGGKRMGRERKLIPVLLFPHFEPWFDLLCFTR